MAEGLPDPVLTDRETLLSIGGIGDRRGGTLVHRFHTNPTLETIRVLFDSDIIIRGVINSGFNLCVSRTGYTWNSGIADQAGTLLAQGSEVRNDVVYGGQLAGYFHSLNFWVMQKDGIYISKNQAATVDVILYYDFVS